MSLVDLTHLVVWKSLVPPVSKAKIYKDKRDPNMRKINLNKIIFLISLAKHIKDLIVHILALEKKNHPRKTFMSNKIKVGPWISVIMRSHVRE